MNSNAEAALHAAEERRFQALLAGDFDVVEELSDERLVVTHASGKRDTRDSFMSSLRSGFIRYTRVDYSVENVISTNDAAVVTGRLRAGLTVGGNEVDIDNAATSVWTQHEGSWVLLAFHVTALG